MRSAASSRFVVVGLLTVFAAACGGQDQNFMASGDRLFAEQNYREAVIQYRNAVDQEPSSGEARYKLAQALVLAGEPGAAVREFVRAADLLPDDDAVQLDAARALLRVELFEDATTRVERVLKRSPEHVDAHILRAHAAAGAKDFDSAMDSIEGAIHLDPSRSASYVRLGALRRLAGRDAMAEAAYKQAVAVTPQAAAPHLALANFYWRQGRADDAERAVRSALEVEPANVKANRALSRLFLMTNRPAEAEAPLRRVAGTSDDLQDRLVLGDYLVSRKQLDAALAVFEALTAEDAAAAAARARIAGIRYEQGHPDQAHALLDELIAAQPGNAELLVIKGGWLLAEDKLDEALARAQAAAAANPKLAAAHILLGSVHTERREHEQAIKAFNEAIAVDSRALLPRVQITRLQLAAGRPEAALASAQDAVRIHPSSGDAQFEVARALFATGNVTRAESELRPVLEVASDHADVQTLLGQIKQRQGDRVTARRAFERAVELDPSSSVEALAGLVTLDVGDRQVAQARRRVDAHLQKMPDNAPLLLLAARTYATAGDVAAAERTLRRAIEVAPSYFPAYTVLGQLYIQQAKLDEARREYEAITVKRPNDVAAMTMVAMILQVQNKPDEARRKYEQILEVDPRAVVAANNLAFMHAESGGNLDIALQLAQAAKAAAPDDPDVDDTLGWVYYKRDLPQMAIEPLRRSVDKDPSNPTYVYHLGLAYLKAGDTARARQSLEKALGLDSSFAEAAEARRVLASIQG